jgi:hypothetical protein
LSYSSYLVLPRPCRRATLTWLVLVIYGTIVLILPTANALAATSPRQAVAASILFTLVGFTAATFLPSFDKLGFRALPDYSVLRDSLSHLEKQIKDLRNGIGPTGSKPIEDVEKGLSKCEDELSKQEPLESPWSIEQLNILRRDLECLKTKLGEFLKRAPEELRAEELTLALSGRKMTVYPGLYEACNNLMAAKERVVHV